MPATPAPAERWVLHIDMDAFFASCEQLTRPTLRGRPVLVGGTSGRGVVAGASYEARAFGAHSAMPMMRARRLIGYSGIVVTPRFAVYKAASRRVMAIVREEAGVIEQLSVDEAFLEPEELRGATADAVRAWAERLRARIRRETGLPSSVGAGSGKQFAKIASGLAKPDGVTVIPRDQEHRILDPLPVRKLWGVGPVAEAKLSEIGVKTIAQFAQMSRADVEMTLGKTLGPALWELARGHDPRPVEPRAIAKQISSESTFPEDLTTIEEVLGGIERALDKALRRLEKDGRGARTVTVKLKRADFQQHTRSETLPFATTDRDILLAVANRQVADPHEFGPIRLVGVSLSGLETAQQAALFPELDIAKQALIVQLRDTRNAADAELESGVGPGAQEAAAAANGSAAVGSSQGAGDGGGAEAPGAGTETETGAGTEIGTGAGAGMAEDSARHWPATIDVYHQEFGHGWVQGSGHGVVSVRFETRTSTAGKVKTFPVDTTELRPADPLDSLDWDDWPGLRSADGE